MKAERVLITAFKGTSFNHTLRSLGLLQKNNQWVRLYKCTKVHPKPSTPSSRILRLFEVSRIVYYRWYVLTYFSLHGTGTLFNSKLSKQKPLYNTTNNLLFCIHKLTRNQIIYFPVANQSWVVQGIFLSCKNTSIKRSCEWNVYTFTRYKFILITENL